MAAWIYMRYAFQEQGGVDRGPVGTLVTKNLHIVGGQGTKWSEP